MARGAGRAVGNGGGMRDALRSAGSLVSLALVAGGRVMNRARPPWPRLEAAAMMAEARRRTRLHDFEEDATFRIALEKLLDSYDRESHLHLLGRVAARRDTVRLLSSRLRLIEDRRVHPEIAAEQIRAPIFITGLPRTGTTLLHGLLAQDPAHRAPLHWECVYPSPPPERATWTTDRRIATAARQLRWFHRLQPAIKPIHPLGARLPEECLVIHSHSFLSFQFQTSHHVPSYEAWLEATDLTPSYEWHRRMLQQLQWHCPADRWVLKAPAHLFGLPALFAIYPDARVVFTHRDPVQVSASLASLTTVLRRTFSAVVDPVAVAREMTVRWSGAIDRAYRDRDAGVAPASQFFDVRYKDLVRDPLGTVRRLYAHYGLTLTDAAADRMQRFLLANPQGRDGRHAYGLAEFGLDADEERARYRAYSERVGV